MGYMSRARLSRYLFEMAPIGESHWQIYARWQDDMVNTSAPMLTASERTIPSHTRRIGVRAEALCVRFRSPKPCLLLTI